jgi:hypothetical protein
VRNEIKSQVSTLGIATKDDIRRLEGRINQLAKAPGKKAAPRKAAAKRPAAKKTSGANKA